MAGRHRGAAGGTAGGDGKVAMARDADLIKGSILHRRMQLGEAVTTTTRCLLGKIGVARFSGAITPRLTGVAVESRRRVREVEVRGHGRPGAACGSSPRVHLDRPRCPSCICGELSAVGLPSDPGLIQLRYNHERAMEQRDKIRQVRKMELEALGWNRLTLREQKRRHVSGRSLPPACRTCAPTKRPR